MEIAFRIGNRQQEQKIIIDKLSLELTSVIKDVETGYTIECEGNTYLIAKGYAINSFEVFLGSDKIMCVYCGFGNDKKNELTYNILRDRHSCTVKKGCQPSFKMASSPYFIITYKYQKDFPKDLITYISKTIYISVLNKKINYDWNGTKSI